MSETTPDKWLSRAMAYENILANAGVEEGEKYVQRYLDKIDRFLEACWKLHKMKLKDEEPEGGFR